MAGWKGIGRGRIQQEEEREEAAFVEDDPPPPPAATRSGPRPPPAAGTEVQGLHNLPCRAARSHMGCVVVPEERRGRGGGRGRSYDGITRPRPQPGPPEPSVPMGNTVGLNPGPGEPRRKMNGYLLFALNRRRQRERETGQKIDTSVDQVLRMFDEDWRKLSDAEKAMWKEKAKGPAPPPQKPRLTDNEEGGYLDDPRTNDKDDWADQWN